MCSCSRLYGSLISEWNYCFWITVGRQTWHFCCSYDRFMCPNSALLFFLLIRVSNFFNRTSLTSLQMPLNPLWPQQHTLKLQKYMNLLWSGLPILSSSGKSPKILTVLHTLFYKAMKEIIVRSDCHVLFKFKQFAG